MMLMALVAFAIVSTPITDTYAYAMLAELTLETVALWGFLFYAACRKERAS